MAVKSTSSKSDHKSVSAKVSSDSQSFTSVVKEFLYKYKTTTPKKLRVLDAYLAYVLLTGIIQFIYCCIAGTFPFNSFLSGFISCVASFILAVCLRMHSNPQNKNVFIPFCPESAYADFIFAHVILHLVVFNFIG
uniref:Dolichyl-diphosphooligosaccharide--protein glycosyltransferase subunit DAD1 n=1 Tax=Schistosoma japonicum TaxID=6182 RepID=C1LT84_SCHJA|nr:Dolichyl-diphosphooligosaccharide--protein glycosyltransferase subunit DAD1 [Schistosoma japonicum]CAX77902.1 Dolichyl-diphosphooligosaccharide--protein glycosyltransferase subunit DAD1 [Schistosoma japonicum]CAX77912.1 Dolichyl-diphosphooligosaccharide--protein glycosyltransferase subunit DAD1 [Schistosoma japonicum]